ncbi:hypothetical protein RF11_03570 [Thelohanellus kitauei]|uniref:Uncharacterized protein n=1 Tax=Thelohanellus kitauei TaxID=669202 RepID=A0A0C2J849_THEKT|nr:hypothetical protein RF11_03570 [Thelohanellus kitauei]
MFEFHQITKTLEKLWEKYFSRVNAKLQMNDVPGINLNEGSFKEYVQDVEVTTTDHNCPNLKLYDPKADKHIQDSRNVKKSHVEKHVTVILKTGGRYELLSTLVHSKNKFYPNMHIIIVDDEWNAPFEEEIKKYKEATYVAMNETVGISKGKVLAE